MKNDGLKEYFGSNRKNVIIIYFLYGIALIVQAWPLLLLGFVMSYVNKDAGEKIFRSHYKFLNNTFFLSILSFIISFLTALMFNILVFPVGLVLYFWIVMRVGIGFKYILDSKAHPRPYTFWIG